MAAQMENVLLKTDPAYRQGFVCKARGHACACAHLCERRDAPLPRPLPDGRFDDAARLHR
jgi:hypothetical protein